MPQSKPRNAQNAGHTSKRGFEGTPERRIVDNLVNYPTFPAAEYWKQYHPDDWDNCDPKKKKKIIDRFDYLKRTKGPNQLAQLWLHLNQAQPTRTTRRTPPPRRRVSFITPSASVPPPSSTPLQAHRLSSTFNIMEEEEANPPITRTLNFDNPEKNGKGVIALVTRNIQVGTQVVDKLQLLFQTDDPRDAFFYESKMNPGNTALIVREPNWPMYWRDNTEAMHEHDGDENSAALHAAAVTRMRANPAVYFTTTHYLCPHGVTCSVAPFSRNGEVHMYPASAQVTFGEKDEMDNDIYVERNFVVVDLAINRANPERTADSDEMANLKNRFGNLGL